jgi:hypothetical protein
MACIASTAGPERQGGNYLCCPRQAIFYKGGQQCCSQVQEIAASQADCGRDRQCLSRCDRMAAARETFISVQDRRTTRYIFLMQKKKKRHPSGKRDHMR